MKNKWIVIIILIAIIVINPSKKGNVLSFIGKQDIGVTNVKRINIENKYDSVIYSDSVVYYDGAKLKSVNEKGEELFSLDIKSNNYMLSANNYIDILDKDNSLIYSINKSGKIVFKKKVAKEGLIYKSLSENLYVYAYKKDDKNIFTIYDNEYSVINNIETKGDITDIESFDKNIYIVEMNTEESLHSKIYKYDYNGNLKGDKKIDNSIVLDLNSTKEKLILVKDDSISLMNSNLESKESIDTKDLKYYSNIYDDGLYIIDTDNNISYLKDKKKKNINSEINPRGIINKGDKSIIYTKNTLETIKNKEIKNYKEEITKVDIVKDDVYMVNLNGFIDIIKVK